MFIPSDDVGAVIGKRGSTVLNIAKVAQARAYNIDKDSTIKKEMPKITIPIMSTSSFSSNSSSSSNSNSNSNKDSDEYINSGGPSSLWSEVQICGDVTSVIEAGNLLLTLVTDSDQVVASIPLTRSRHATIIGSRGGTIRKLSADNAVRIMVPNKGDGKSDGKGDGNGQERSDQPTFNKREVAPVLLEGEFVDMVKCLHEILSMIHEVQVGYIREKEGGSRKSTRASNNDDIDHNNNSNNSDANTSTSTDDSNNEDFNSKTNKANSSTIDEHVTMNASVANFFVGSNPVPRAPNNNEKEDGKKARPPLIKEIMRLYGCSVRKLRPGTEDTSTSVKNTDLSSGDDETVTFSVRGIPTNVTRASKVMCETVTVLKSKSDGEDGETGVLALVGAIIYGAKK